jgi:hypothetical protein
MPKCIQERAKNATHNIYLSDTKMNALMAYEQFIEQFEDWNARSLVGKKYAYMWADGIHLKVRLGNGHFIHLIVKQANILKVLDLACDCLEK